MFCPHCIDPDSFIQPPDQNTTLSNSHCCLSSCNVAQEDTVGFHQRRQDIAIHGPAYQEQTYGGLRADTTSYNDSNNVIFSCTGSAARLDGRSNGPDHLCLGAEAMMLQDGLVTVSNNQFEEWCLENGTMSFADSLADTSSAPTLYSYPTPGQTVMTGFGDFSGLEDIDMQDAEIPDGTNNLLLDGQQGSVAHRVEVLSQQLNFYRFLPWDTYRWR
jgi:hypothetical protein